MAGKVFAAFLCFRVAAVFGTGGSGIDAFIIRLHVSLRVAE